MVLAEIDRKLLHRCLNRKPHAWEDFVERFLGLVLHVIRHTAKSRSIRLTAQDEEDLTADFFMAVIQDDYLLLRRFRGESSLATYLTVVARRVVVRELLRKRSRASSQMGGFESLPDSSYYPPEERIEDHEEAERLLRKLSGHEAQIVRLYHLEGKSYREISVTTGLPENSIGPTLSRARAKLRQVVGDVASG